jgi:phosphoglycolate phosphatase-like HAD superfamily hydrolase
VRLFLFDVDGTLLTARGAGREAFERALARVYGTAGPVQQYDFRGKTDPQIVVDLMGAAGLDPAAIRVGLGPFFDAYITELETLLSDGARVQLMPGMAEIVRTLGARTDAVVGLLTGNIERGARAKLQPTGLLPCFRLGAYGSDDPDRRRLPAVACARARALTGREFPFARVTIIGDTPLDVDCARACGARAVVVATGHHAAHELAACRPDLLFPDFADVDRVLRALTDP